MFFVAQANPVQLHSLFSETANSYEVKLHYFTDAAGNRLGSYAAVENYEATSGGIKARISSQTDTFQIMKTAVLTRGVNGAIPSGDYDDNGVEVWTIVLEQALVKAFGNIWAGDGGGRSEYPIALMTGKFGELHRAPVKGSEILAALAAGKTVNAALLTAPTDPSSFPPSLSGLYNFLVAPHEYNLELRGGKVFLVDPRNNDPRDYDVTNEMWIFDRYFEKWTEYSP